MPSKALSERGMANWHGTWGFQDLRSGWTVAQRTVARCG
jgi:hypothetical protein